MKKLRTQEPVKYRISSIDKLTHDTSAFRFEIPEDTALDFRPGDHIAVHADVNGEIHERPYTPTSTPDDTGFFELIIKRYPNGLVSTYMHTRYIGEEVYIQGPNPGGYFEQGMAVKVGMVAGGAGVTPMISIIRTAIRRKWAVDMALIYANKTVDDIILRDELENYAAANSNFKVIFAVNEPAAKFGGHVGFIDESLLKQHLPTPSENPLIYLCGPPMMEHKLREKILLLGYDKKRLIVP